MDPAQETLLIHIRLYAQEYEPLLYCPSVLSENSLKMHCCRPCTPCASIWPESSCAPAKWRRCQTLETSVPRWLAMHGVEMLGQQQGQGQWRGCWCACALPPLSLPRATAPGCSWLWKKIHILLWFSGVSPLCSFHKRHSSFSSSQSSFYHCNIITSKNPNQ